MPVVALSLSACVEVRQGAQQVCWVCLEPWLWVRQRVMHTNYDAGLRRVRWMRCGGLQPGGQAGKGGLWVLGNSSAAGRGGCSTCGLGFCPCTLG